MAKRILYVSGSYIPAAGGSEQTMHTLMKSLFEDNYEVLVLTRAEGTHHGQEIIDQVNILRIDSEELEDTLGGLIKSFQPEVIMTQLMWSDRVMKVAKQLSIPLVYFVRSIGGNMDLSNEAEFRCDFLVANSKVTQKYLKETFNRDSIIMHPLIDLKQYIAPQHTPRYITMINPITVKGGDIFKQIAKKLPDQDFMAVQGWSHLKSSTGQSWDVGKLQEMAQAFNDQMHVPEEVDLTEVPNTKVLSPVEDMRPIYAQTKLLLMPSLWEEAFGRVVVEAMANGIPVIASNKGNLSDTVGTGGVLIDVVENIDLWTKAIKELSIISTYKKYSHKAVISARRFDLKGELAKVEFLLNNI